MENYTNIPVYNIRFTGILLEKRRFLVFFPSSDLLYEENSECSGTAVG